MSGVNRDKTALVSYLLVVESEGSRGAVYLGVI
jgi:hypothetical protein